MSRYGSNANAEMQQFVQQQQQNAALKQVINKLTDKCWDMCVGKIGSSLSSREVSCLSQCSQRFARLLCDHTRVAATRECCTSFQLGKACFRISLRLSIERLSGFSVYSRLYTYSRGIRTSLKPECQTGIAGGPWL